MSDSDKAWFARGKFGQWLVLYRKGDRIPRKTIAAKLGITIKELEACERGKWRPDEETAHEWTKALGLHWRDKERFGAAWFDWQNHGLD